MNFDKESISEKNFRGIKNADGGGGGEGGGGNTETKTVCQTVKRGKIQNSNHLHNVKCKACSTIKITKYVNIVQTLQL